MKKSLLKLLIGLICCLVYSFSSLNEESRRKELKERKYQNFTTQDGLDYYPKKLKNPIIKHSYYSLSYNEKHEQADWVAYTLLGSNLTYSKFKRPFFIQDKLVATHSADWRNYKNSGYDKGHLCPAADMKFSKKAYNDTFLTSNISPQKHDFNDGIWNRLEEKVRYWANKHDKVYVISGGVLENNLKTIGYEKVSVPKYFYKIIARGKLNSFKMIAFLIPHQESKEPLYKYVVSVDKLEALTKQDFFHTLNDELETKLEKTSDYKDWSFK